MVTDVTVRLIIITTLFIIQHHHNIIMCTMYHDVMECTCRNRTGALNAQRLPKINVYNIAAALDYSLRCIRSTLNIVIKRVMNHRQGITRRGLFCTQNVNNSKI